MKKRQNLSSKVVYSLALAVAVYLVLSVWGASGDIREAADRFRWSYFPVLLLLALANYVLRFAKWQYYLRILNISIPVYDSFVIHMSGLALSITPGKLGEVVKSRFLKLGFGQSIARTAPIVFADRLTDMFALIILCAFGAYGFSYGQNIVWIITILSLLLLLVIVVRPIGLAVISIFERFPVLARKVHKLRELYDSSYALLQPKRIAWPLIIAVISWGFEAIAFYLVFQAFDLNGSVMAAVFIYSFSTIVGAVSMLPGGLGMTEGLIAGLMKMLEIDTAVAALSTVIIRLATLWFAVVIGLAFLLMAEKRFGANVTDLMLEQEV